MNNKIELEEEKVNPREERGKIIALERAIYRIINSGVFYVESQETEGLVYFVGFKPSRPDDSWCSCPDNSVRRIMCKHIFAIEYAIRKGTVIDTDKLPEGVKRDNKPVSATKSYKDDEYSF